MVQLEAERSTQCVVYDKSPGSEQKKINIVVRPSYTVGKVISDIRTQYQYKAFDLVLQPQDNNKDLVYLNSCQQTLIYDVPGFDASIKTTLILLPPDVWDENVKQRYDLSLTTQANTPKSNHKNSATKSIKENNNTNHISNNNNNNMLNNSNNNDMSPKNVGTIINCKDGISGGSSGSGNCDVEMSDLNISAEITPPTSTITSGVANMTSMTDSYNMSPISEPDLMSDDDLALGASASPTETEPSLNALGPLTHTSPNQPSYASFDSVTEADLYQKADAKSTTDRYYDFLQGSKRKVEELSSSPVCSNPTNEGIKYVGLVNQAMTCYLNSLLQALYMTPEFRNALYRWESDNENEAKNIPYQLQKIFLKLQTSKKSAVETTDLTRSFGWDSTEAWQQHDVQELCRVMFDALEHKFKNTKQMNLISNLYEGQMIDYVKCLECNTEKTRADTFLDIPLPVRPFGSTVAYGSIEEALRAFVQPETLNGNNQYFCEICNKKCDAHKGLKFKTFPYILTLHLKRFDFDYQTMHRIKLNDKVTFPQTLNLNTFINSADAGSAFAAAAATTTVHNGYVINGMTTATNTDDYSTTDSGSTMEEDNLSSGIVTTASSSQHENDMNDDDEGIDISPNSTQHRKTETGPYLYELFAIMIHSGSASGGHYYAYIKEIKNNEWFCFNDQSVTPITEEDIQKSFGGSPTKAYYPSVYSSSTNAYMLMYRQIEPKRNEHAIGEEEFPKHIQYLLPKLLMEDELRLSRHSRHTSGTDLPLGELFKPRVYFYNPELKKWKVTRIYISNTFDINSVLDTAYQMLEVEQFVPISLCRLVGFDFSSEEILQSFENVKDPSLTEIRFLCDGGLDFLLEYRTADQTFEVYEPGSATWRVYMVNLQTLEIDGPHLMCSAAHEFNSVLRHSIAVRLHINENELLLATLRNKRAFVAYDPTPTLEAQEKFQSLVKSTFSDLTYFYLNVPNTDPSNLKTLGIPSFEAPSIEVSSDCVDAALMSFSSNNNNNNNNNNTIEYYTTSSALNHLESPLPSGTKRDSNSEDSSLSDGDRTLVESIQNRGGGDSQISSNSHSPQLSSPDDECIQDSYNRINDYFNGGAQRTENEALTNHNKSHYFHALKINAVDSSDLLISSRYRKTDVNDSASDDASPKYAYSYKINADMHMKMGTLKRHIETLIHVPAKYFKMERKHDTANSMNSSNTLIFVNDGETFNIKLGKVLEPNEHKAKIYFLRLSEINNEVGKLPYICDWIYNSTLKADETRKELISKLQGMDGKKYQTLTMDNCRVWTKTYRNSINRTDFRLEIFDGKPVPDDELGVEFVVQETEVVSSMNGSEVVTRPDSLTLFVRCWNPDTLELDKFEEITIDKDSEIRSVLSKLSGIPEEDIAYSKVNGSFPCTNISILNIKSMIWLALPATLDKYPLTTTDNGSVYFYKDVNKAHKELTLEQRQELGCKEKARIERLGCSSSSVYSPRRERALKIYLDSPQTTTSNVNA